MTNYLKKHLLLIVLFCIILFALLLILFNKSNNDIISNSDNMINNANNSMFAIMLETEAESGKYQESNSGTWPGEGYIFNENLSVCENGGELSWNEELGAINLKTNIADKCYVYFDMANPVSTLAEYIIDNVYIEDGTNDLYYHDSQGNYTNADQEAEDNSYRYSGANPNNYVCFGSVVSPCPSENLYRIIGVFNQSGEYQVKLIKSVSIGNYAWDSINNTWSSSTIKNLLNSQFLNSFDSSWKDLIVTHTFKVGGMASSDLYTVKNYYDIEVGNNSNSVEDSVKIGLVYVSDYGYAASNNYWTTALYNYDEGAQRNNWMYSGSTEWTISRSLSGSGYVFSINLRGYVVDFANGSYAVRPTFYINSDVEYAFGDGSIDNPFRIVV